MQQAATLQQGNNIQNTPIKEIMSSQDNRDEEMLQPSSTEEKDHKMKKKRKRKIHKHKPQLDPQEIKEIRMERLNIKRQYLWDNRFVNETIPDILQSKSKKKFNLNSKKGKSSVQIYMDKAKNKAFEKTVFPAKDAIPKQTHKSFKIRHLKQQAEKIQKKPRSQNGNKTPLIMKPNEGQQQKQMKQIVSLPAKKQKRGLKMPKKPKQRESNQLVQSQKSNKQGPQAQKQGQLQQPRSQITKRLTIQQKLLIKLKQKLRIFPINNASYQQMITDLISRCGDKKHKQFRNKIQKQIDLIGTQKNSYIILATFIEDRRKIIKDLIKHGDNSPLKLYVDFQLYSLSIIELLLKYKAKWEQIYDYFQMKKKVIFIYQGKNYLTSMKHEVKQLCGDVLDPFLIKKTNKLHKLVDSSLSNDMIKERKDMVMKIRACQLLLIEEQLQQLN